MKEHEYMFAFLSKDPDKDDIYYYVKWGDGNETGWIGPYESDDTILLKHTWKEKGKCVIEAKAKDVLGLESDWSKFKITVPKNIFIYSFPFLNWLFERFPHAIPILRYLFGL